MPVGCPLHEARGWRYDLDELESKITPKTRVLYLNSPNNPSGGVLTRADLERLAAIAQRTEPLGDLRRGLRGRRVRRRARQHRVAAGHVRAHDPALHVQQVVRDDGAAPRLRRRSRIRRFAIAPRRCCSTRRATSRRSCSSAASARSRDRRTASKTFRTELRARRDLFYAGVRELSGGVFSGTPPAGAFYAFLKIDPAWLSSPARCAMRSRTQPGIAVVADGRISDQERHASAACRASTSVRAAKATSASVSRATGRSSRARCNR